MICSAIGHILPFGICWVLVSRFFLALAPLHLLCKRHAVANPRFDTEFEVIAPLPNGRTDIALTIARSLGRSLSIGSSRASSKGQYLLAATRVRRVCRCLGCFGLRPSAQRGIYLQHYTVLELSPFLGQIPPP